MKLGFKNFYLYSAVNSKSGDSFSYLYSKVDTDCFNHFLQEFSQEHQGKEIIMIMDGAGWHKSHNLKMPKNIQKVLLPPYCPELNPVERLWQYIKNNTIKNKVFETIRELEDEVCRFVNELTKDVIMNICKT